MDNSTIVSYQQARRDPVPYLVRSSSGAFYVVTSSEHVVVRARHFPGFCFLRLSQGTLESPPFSLKGGGGPEVLKGALDARVLLSVGVVIVFASLEPELTDYPPFSVKFWHNPWCHMNYLDN